MCEMYFWVAEIPTKPFSSEWKHFAFVKPFTSRTWEVLTFTLRWITKYLLLFLTFISWAASFFSASCLAAWCDCAHHKQPPDKDCCLSQCHLPALPGRMLGVREWPPALMVPQPPAQAREHWATGSCTYFCVYVDGLRPCTWESECCCR